MNILLNGSKKHLLLLQVIFFALSSFSESLLEPDPFLSVSTKGFITGKFQKLDIYQSSSDLNNHGAFYGEVTPVLYFNKSNFLSLGFYVMNEEFSEIDKFSISPLIYANIGNDKTDSSIRWNIKSGILTYTTVGCGLTLKDFRQIGAQGSISIGGFNTLVNIWAQGYTKHEDIYWLRIFHEKFPIGLNVLLWSIRGETDSPIKPFKYYYTIYALPYVKKNWRNFGFYLEYGYKYKEKNNVSNTYGYSPHKANAVLYGLSYIDTLFKFKVAINPEFRYYGKGFIPNTGISDKFLGRLETWYQSTNNWVDFFNSREKSVWFYTKFYIETPILAGFSIYFHDELLFFNSSQKTLLVELQSGERTYIAFNPSTNFYKAGLKYSLMNNINISFNISNQLINNDPFLRGEYKNQQYMERFYPTDKLFFELLLYWQINNIRKKKKV